MSYRPTDTSEKALVALIVVEMTGRTDNGTLPVGEVREYVFYGESADMSTYRQAKDTGPAILSLKTNGRASTPKKIGG